MGGDDESLGTIRFAAGVKLGPSPRPLRVVSRLRPPATVPRPTVCPPVARKGPTVDQCIENPFTSGAFEVEQPCRLGHCQLQAGHFLEFRLDPRVKISVLIACGENWGMRIRAVPHLRLLT